MNEMNVFMDSLVGGYTVPVATNYALLLKSMSGGVLKFAFRMRNFRSLLSSHQQTVRGPL